MAPNHRMHGTQFGRGRVHGLVETIGIYPAVNQLRRALLEATRVDSRGSTATAATSPWFSSPYYYIFLVNCQGIPDLERLWTGFFMARRSRER